MPAVQTGDGFPFQHHGDAPALEEAPPGSSCRLPRTVRFFSTPHFALDVEVGYNTLSKPKVLGYVVYVFGVINYYM